MLNHEIIEELSNKIKEITSNSPIGDLDKNLHALFQGAFTKTGLISREEFDVQAEVLRKTREKLEILEKKLQELEKAAQQ